MHTRFLTVLAVSAFVLTLLFAVAAGAQDESTDASGSAVLGGGGGIQVRQVQQQQVTTQAARCPGSQTERTVRDPTTRRVIHPDIEGDAVLVTYQITQDPADPDDELVIELRDEDGDIIFLEEVRGDTAEPQKVRVLTNPGEHEFRVDADAGLKYFVRLEDCTNFEARNDGGGNDGGGNNDGTTTDGTTTDGTTTAGGVTPTQADTTGGTTTDGTTTGTGTSDPTAELTTANNASDSANREGSFRCDSFLRVVRDENGALRRQYNGDELVVQRFEQCLEADVLANTIPDRLLPNTGGSSLPFGGGALLLATGAALALRMIRR